ncbi:MAG: hypothetical protein KAR11_01145 [Phycisphaerae bacterium]|nr:hypothetical protein [Phycisphaerae bacterium]
MTKKLLMLLLVLGFATSGLFAQEAAEDEMEMPPPPFKMDQPKASSLLKVIPSDCMGYAAATNFKDMVTNIERLGRQLGFGDELDAVAPIGLLQTAAMFLSIGEGFNPNGGLAVVIPNLEKLGFDPAALGRGEEPEDPEMPFVFLVAGTSATGILPQAEKMEDGSMMLMGMPVPIYTAKIGDYVAFSPSQKALALMKGETLDATLGKEEKSVLTKNDIAIFYNLKVAGPFVATMMENADGAEDSSLGVTVELGAILKLYGSFLKQIDGLAFGVTLGEEGISCEFYESFKPGSDLAKVVSAYKALGKPLMDRLPNLPYVLALGASVSCAGEGKQMSAVGMQCLEMLVKMGDMTIPEDIKAKIIKVDGEFNDLLTGVQIVAGPANGEGIFGLSIVMNVTDAGKAKALLQTEVDLITQLVQALLEQKPNEDLASLKFTYKAGAETINDAAVDTIEVTFDKLNTRTEKQKADMKKALGEDQILFRVAQVDPKTLVITFGGAKSYMSASIDAARKGGTIDKDPNVLKTLAKLPAKRVATMVLSTQNMYNLVQAGMVLMGEKSDLPAEFKFQCAQPIGIGWALSGENAVKGTIYVPIGVVKDVVELIKAEQAAAIRMYEDDDEDEVEVIEEK